MSLATRFVCCAAIFVGLAPDARAFVPCVNPSPATILEQSRDAAQYVFIARVTNLNWVDRFENYETLGFQPEYPSGVVKASFKLLQVFKGGPPPFATIDEVLYGNPSSNPRLYVATDYIFLLKGNTLYAPGACLVSAQRISFNNWEGWIRRLQSAHPDRVGG